MGAWRGDKRKRIKAIWTLMNTDEHGLKRKFVSPSARKDTKQGYYLIYIKTFLRRRRFNISV
jgi:hypothetical protein